MDWPELRAIGHLNAFVPPGESIILPSRYYVRHGREHLMVAEEPASSVIPYLTTRFVFGVSVGPSSDYGWPDLSKAFCGRSASARAQFLHSVNAHWVLVRGPDAADTDNLEREFWGGGVKLGQLGAKFPPAFAERDIALYRVDP